MTKKSNTFLDRYTHWCSKTAIWILAAVQNWYPPRSCENPPEWHIRLPEGKTEQDYPHRTLPVDNLIIITTWKSGLTLTSHVNHASDEIQPQWRFCLNHPPPMFQAVSICNSTTTLIIPVPHCRFLILMGIFWLKVHGFTKHVKGSVKVWSTNTPSASFRKGASASGKIEWSKGR